MTVSWKSKISTTLSGGDYAETVVNTPTSNSLFSSTSVGRSSTSSSCRMSSSTGSCSCYDTTKKKIRHYVTTARTGTMKLGLITVLAVLYMLLLSIPPVVAHEKQLLVLNTFIIIFPIVSSWQKYQQYNVFFGSKRTNPPLSMISSSSVSSNNFRKMSTTMTKTTTTTTNIFDTIIKQQQSQRQLQKERKQQLLLMVTTRDNSDINIDTTSAEESLFLVQSKSTTTTTTSSSSIITPSSTSTSSSSLYFSKISVPGPDISTRPDYNNIIGPLGKVFDLLFIIVFRIQLAKYVGWDSTNCSLWDYNGIIEITQYMNKTYKSRQQIQETSQAVLVSLFPSWLPNQFGIMFAKPFPIFSAKLNAWATYVAGTWLMGECYVNDIILPDTTNNSTNSTASIVLEKQGLYIKRCRFLEESSCASVCVNSCKVPTQNFFLQNMKLPLRIEPNYTTYECQFSFGVYPTIASETIALSTPCLSRCPTYGAIRRYHDSTEKQLAATVLMNTTTTTTSTSSNPFMTESSFTNQTNNCAIMTD